MTPKPLTTCPVNTHAALLNPNPSASLVIAVLVQRHVKEAYRSDGEGMSSVNYHVCTQHQLELNPPDLKGPPISTGVKGEGTECQ